MVYLRHTGETIQKYFPTVQDRLRLKLKLTPKITAVLTEHGMTKAYLHRFHLREDATCSCGNECQSMDHIPFHCDNTRATRNYDTTYRSVANKQTEPDHQAPEDL